MKKYFSTICMLLLSNLSKAGDFGMDISSLNKSTNQDGVVAMDGTGTCRVAGKSEIRTQSDFEKLTLKQLKEKIRHESSLQRQQEILDLVEKALLDENTNQK